MDETPCNTGSTPLPKMYPSRPGSYNSGMDYEAKITSLLALRCAVMKDTEDLWLGSNVDHVGDFDDIVLLRLTAKGSLAYMIQLKHQESPKSINPQDFVYAVNKACKRKKSKEDFSLSKYSVGFSELKRRLLEPTEGEAEIIEYLRKRHKMVLVLFTNRGVSQCDFLEAVCDDWLCFMNTSYNNKENMFKFDAAKLDYDSDFVEQLVLFANQVHINDLDGLIQSEIKRILGNSKLTSVELKRFSDKFVSCIRTWAKGAGVDYSRRCFALTKTHIVTIISDILLDSYKLDMLKDPYCFSNDPNMTIWNNIVHEKAITVVDADPEDSVLNFLKQYVGGQVSQYCGQAKTWSQSLNKEVQNLFYKENTDLQVEITKLLCAHSKITPYDIYKCLWFSKKLPMLLTIHQAQDYDYISRILKFTKHGLSVVIIKDASLQLPIKKESNVKYFTDITDLTIEDTTAILNQSVKLQGRPSVVLHSLIDKSMYHHIKCRDIIKILSNNFSIGPEYKPLPDYFIQRSLSKVLIKKQVLQAVPDELFLIANVPAEQLDEFASKNCYIANGNRQQMDELKHLKKPLHELSYYDTDNLEWKQSNSSIEQIQQYKSEEQVWSQLSDALQNSNRMHIISAGPGMGKSTYVDFIAYQASTNVWVLKVNLNDHDDYYESLKPKSKATDHLKYFNKAIVEGDRNVNLSMAVFDKLLEAKRILVLLDGFDEISITYKDEVTDIIKCLHKAGFAIWLTTRPVMQLHLEEKFKVISTTLQPFTIDNQESFLTRYFSQPGDHDIIREFVQKLLQAAMVNLNDRDCQFTGVPLQTKLLADVFNDECKTSISRGIVEFPKFDLLYLYKRFIKNKTDIACAKFGKGAKQMRVLFTKHQQLFALKILFPQDLFGLNIDRELDEYYHDEGSKILFLQQEGVVVVRRNTSISKYKFYVRFAHRTFAEYFAAQWLVQNLSNKDVRGTVRTLLMKRFPPDKLHLFLYNIFDQLAAKDCPLHLAILNEDPEGIKENLDSELATIDSAGRSVLHLIALHGLYHPYQGLYNNLQGIKDRMVSILEQLPDDQEVAVMADFIFGWNALDFAVKSYSLAVADALCQRFPKLTLEIGLNVAAQRQYLAYCSWLNYGALCKILLPYFALQVLTLPFVAKVTEVQSLFEDYIDEGNDFITGIISELSSSQHRYSNLHCAAAFGASENVQQLLDEGTDINQHDLQSNTPLHYAAIRKRPDIACLLIVKGAKIDEKGKHQNTPLHYAAESGANDIICDFIDRCADINCRNINNDTPLHFAFLGGHMDTVKLLLSRGASGSVANLNGFSILHYSAMYGYNDIIAKLLRNGEDINKGDHNHMTPLHLAIEENHMDTVKLLLSEGASLECPEEGDSPLHSAALVGNIDLVAELLSRGADIDVLNCDGDPPLHYALLKHQPEVTAKFLLSKGAKGNLSNKRGASTLHYAAQAGAEDVILWLLSQGGELNKLDNNGDPPLHYALEKKRLGAAKLLLSKSATSITSNRRGKSTLHYAAELGDREIVSTLLSQGAELDTVDLNGDTPLHLAAAHNFAITELLANDSIINKQNKRGKTPLQVAIAAPSRFSKEGFQEQVLLVGLLLDKGAGVNLKDSGGNTPLHCACTDYFKELMSSAINIENRMHKMIFYEKVVALLLTKNAKTNIRNYDDKTPLDLAAEAEYNNIVALLQQHIPH